MSKFGDLTRAAAGLSAVERLQLQRELRVEQAVGWPGSKLRCVARSRTELSRAAKIKEPWTAEWVQALPQGAVLWDIGANIGVFSLLAAEAGRVERVVAIEPAPVNYAALVENIILNGFFETILPIAGGLGARTELSWLNLDNEDPGGALHSFGEPLEMPDRERSSKARCASQCYRLDDLAAMTGVPFPTHLKIDIDAFEYEALLGAPATLADARLKGVQVEVVDWEQSRPATSRLRALIEANGFELLRTIDHPSKHPIVSDLQFERRN